MPSEVRITCFTDLKDSTKLTEKLGHKGYMPLLEEHLAVGKCFATVSGGEYHKNIGDAHMLTFTSPTCAFRFATLLQEYCAARPSLQRQPVRVKIGLFNGLVEPSCGDVFASGVNQAARVQGWAKPDQVLVDDGLYALATNLWGKAQAKKYLSSIGKHTLRGVTQPRKRELFQFDWREYGKDNADTSLAGLVVDHLKKANIEIANLSPLELAQGGTVIWPVVPRDIVTAIHRGQAEMIRLFVRLGWRVTILLADCGAQKSYAKPYAKMFGERLKSYCLTRGIKLNDVVYTSDLFEPSKEGYCNVHSLFRKIAADLTLQDLLNINSKNYARNIKDEIKDSKTLDCLRPALTTAGVLCLAQKAKAKCVVVAGQDEQIQWERSMRIPGVRATIGYILNPMLKIDRRYQEQQTKDWPSWDSPAAIVRAMESTNLAWWTFGLHAYIPAFPFTSVPINGTAVKPWKKQIGCPRAFPPEAIADHVWKILNPNL